MTPIQAFAANAQILEADEFTLEVESSGVVRRGDLWCGKNASVMLA